MSGIVYAMKTFMNCFGEHRVYFYFVFIDSVQFVETFCVNVALIFQCECKIDALFRKFLNFTGISLNLRFLVAVCRALNGIVGTHIDMTNMITSHAAMKTERKGVGGRAAQRRAAFALWNSDYH